MRLIVISGLPGSGKSTISEVVAKKLQIPLFSVDPIESAIIKSGIKRSFETGLAAYLVAKSLAAEQLKQGLSVIIDAVNGVKEAHDLWQEAAKESNVELIVIECNCSNKNIHKKRIENRIRNLHGIPEVTWSDVKMRQNDYLKWDIPHLVINTTDSSEKNIEKVLEYIERN